MDRSEADATSTVPGELAGKNGTQFWSSLEELSGTERFKDFLAREYPSQLSRFLDLPERRTVLKLMGASLALAGFNACTRQPEERIVPYAKNPESTIPGTPLYFATAMPWASGAIGLLVENHLGRPTKTEGNELHPASLGAADSFAQASVLGLYDPDRGTSVENRGRVSTWDEFTTALRDQLNVQAARQGSGLRVLSNTITSPTLAEQVRAFLAAYPKATWTQYEPVTRDHARAGAILAFGQDVSVHARYDQARVVVSFEDDFLGGGPEQVRAAREFTKNRRVRGTTQEMNRLYVVESSPTPTGAMADHRLAKRSEDVGNVVRALAAKLGVATSTPTKGLDPATTRFVDALAKDLQSAGGASIVTCGPTQTPYVHALVHAINTKLGAFGKAMRLLPPVECLPQDKGQVDALRALVEDMKAGRVDCLVVIDANPVFDAPADFDFAAALAKVGFRAQFSQAHDETTLACDWFVPSAHYLESWSDARAFDGTVTIVQPLIAPLYGSKGVHDLVAVMMPQPGPGAYDQVRAYWQKQKPDQFEANWRRWLHDGVVPDTQAAAVTPALRSISDEPVVAKTGIEVVFRPDPTVWDGRFANNGWLQELPKPITKVTWDNTVHVSPTTAAKFGLEVGTVVDVKVGGRSCRLPVWVSPGHADDCATVFFGSGRRHSGHVGTNAGSDAYPARTSAGMWTATGATLEKTGDTMKIASTQEHVDYEVVQEEVEKREILRVRTLAAFKADPHSLDTQARVGRPEHPGEKSIYAAAVAGEIERGQRLVSENQWGMVIDLSACTACGACVTACISENNIPVVGKDQVLRGREMHWIRIDRYFEGPKENPRIHHQPIPCMQCENAPCETVCPVGATTHSPEGLNEMTYNRCVGTRYCSNNCPYKVRRFNFLLYSDYATETLKMQRNPDVTVRSRGVMEKCTYCVQRINQARILAKREDRSIREGEVVTACQQTCPASAITFGNVHDANSAVSKLKAEHHNYSLLDAELQTRPRTTFLAKIRNPNPELETA